MVIVHEYSLCMILEFLFELLVFFEHALCKLKLKLFVLHLKKIVQATFCDTFLSQIYHSWMCLQEQC